MQNLLNVCERIPTIGTQLKILSTVKATMLGAQGEAVCRGNRHCEYMAANLNYFLVIFLSSLFFAEFEHRIFLLILQVTSFAVIEEEEINSFLTK